MTKDDIISAFEFDWHPNPSAKYHCEVGNEFIKGTNRKFDALEAEASYRKAIEMGDIAAKRNLANLLLVNPGSEERLKEAYSLIIELILIDAPDTDELIKHYIENSSESNKILFTKLCSENNIDANYVCSSKNRKIKEINKIIRTYYDSAIYGAITSFEKLVDLSEKYGDATYYVACIVQITAHHYNNVKYANIAYNLYEKSSDQKSRKGNRCYNKIKGYWRPATLPKVNVDDKSLFKIYNDYNGSVTPIPSSKILNMILSWFTDYSSDGNIKGDSVADANHSSHE